MFYYFEICFHADILLEKLNENIKIIVGTWKNTTKMVLESFVPLILVEGGNDLLRWPLRNQFKLSKNISIFESYTYWLHF